MFKNMKLDIAESSVCRWRDVVGESLDELVKWMKSEIKQSYCINTDATTAPFRIPKENHRSVNGDAVPLLDALFQRCRESLADPAILPKSRIALACKYALNNETAFRGVIVTVPARAS